MKIIGLALLVAMVALLFLCGTLMVGERGEDKSFYIVVTLSFQLIGMGLSIMFFVILLSDSTYNQATQQFILMMFECYALFFFSFISWIYDGDPEFYGIVVVTNYACYLLFISVMYTFWIFVLCLADRRSRIMKKMDIAATASYFIGIAMIFGNMLFHYYFTIDGNAHFALKDTFFLSFLFPFIIQTFYTIAIALFIKERRKKIAMYSFTIFITVGSALEILYLQVEVLYIAVLLSLIIIYGNFYVGRSQDLMKKDAELVQQRAEILVSQIQPHFLYNALTSIMNIKGNPPETRDAISDFGKYLRGNLDTLRQKGPIPILMEIDHVETFMMLEALNLGEGLKLELDIRDRDFLIPALTLQTLVEKCIDEGYPRKNPVGTIRVSTEETDSAHTVIIEDDGDGTAAKIDASDVFGFSSIETHLKESVNAVMDIQNVPGVGTTITIAIPKNAPKKSLLSRL